MCATGCYVRLCAGWAEESLSRSRANGDDTSGQMRRKISKADEKEAINAKVVMMVYCREIDTPLSYVVAMLVAAARGKGATGSPFLS
jgi:hypothetical protein